MPDMELSAAARPPKPDQHRTRAVGRLRLGLTLVLAVCCVVAAIYGTVTWLGTTQTAQAGVATRYGANYSRFHAIVRATWPQTRYNFCGVATVAAIATYDWRYTSQGDVGNYLDSAPAVSEWGQPWPETFNANISNDFGTDPRALAASLSAFAGGPVSQFVGFAGNWNATLNLVDDLYYTRQPISVIVDHGAHSVVVDAVYATANPVSQPNSITSLEVWDPAWGSGFQSVSYGQVAWVGLHDWLTNANFWGQPYDQNYIGRYGALDPDPAIGPYRYNWGLGERTHLWIGHYVYLRPYRRVGVSADWAFNQNFALIRGAHGEKPAGYTGPSVPL
jgi:hypothetical protein